MFRARKFPDAPGKRLGGPLPKRYDTPALSKRPRLIQQEGEFTGLLVDSSEWKIAALGTLPSNLKEELKCLKNPRIHNCEVLIRSGKTRATISNYFVFALSSRLLIWHGESKAVTLMLPTTSEPNVEIYPFIFQVYEQNLSLMVVTQTGLVLFWEDLDLPYESVPLSVQIPLNTQERIYSHRSANAEIYDDFNSIFCWSNAGNVWEVTMEGRRIRVRSFEKKTAGFLSGLTESVSQFFFSRKSSSSDSNINHPIKLIRVSEASDELQDTRDMILVFENGMVEQRTFSVDPVDCACSTSWELDLERATVHYFRDSFSEQHLSKVFVLDLPLVYENGFAALVAFICTSAVNDAQLVVKYALLQFKNTSSSNAPQMEWAYVLDYEPNFIEEQLSRFLNVESFALSQNNLYLVWPFESPVQLSSILLPPNADVTSNTSILSVSIDMEGSDECNPCAFGGHIESIAEEAPLTGSLSFLLLRSSLADGSANGDNLSVGSACLATASNMQHMKQQLQAEKSFRKLQTAANLSSISDQNIDEYVDLIKKLFANDAMLSLKMISSSNMDIVAKAAVMVDFQILDARPSSGLRWGNDHLEHSSQSSNGTDLAVVTPKLVRYQLEEKLRRHDDYVTFLQMKCPDVWHHIQDTKELYGLLIQDEEKLQAALALCKFQGSLSPEGKHSPKSRMKRCSGRLLIQAIEENVTDRGYDKRQLLMTGYNAFDIFYSEVSKLSELFYALNKLVQQASSSAASGTIGDHLEERSYLNALLECNYSMINIIRAVTQLREIKRRNVKTKQELWKSSFWIFSPEIRHILLDQISRTASLLGYNYRHDVNERFEVGGLHLSPEIQSDPEIVFELTDQIQELGCFLLNGLVVAKAQGDHSINTEMENSKKVVLTPLIYIATTFSSSAIFSEISNKVIDEKSERKRAELFGQCIKQCEKYSFYEGMLFLALIEDQSNIGSLDYALGKVKKSNASLRLYDYCEQYEGFSNFVFRWYAGEVDNPWPSSTNQNRDKLLARLLADAKFFDAKLQNYLKEHDNLSKYCWLVAVATNKFDQATTLALHEASKEKQSLAIRKNLSSIAKLAALAVTPSPGKAENIHRINKELLKVKIQEALLSLPTGEQIYVRPMSCEELVDACLYVVHHASADDPLRPSLFMMSLEALDSIRGEVSESSYEALNVKVWRQCILEDEEVWKHILTEYSDGVNESRLEKLMRQTLLYICCKRYNAQMHEPSITCAALSMGTIDDVVQQEVDSDSVISLRSRQLFVKTLNLAIKS